MVGDDAHWHSAGLYYVYLSLGWVAFVAWTISFYPQVILNYQRKSVVGLTLDFVIFNFTKHSAYLIYNAAMYFSPVVQEQYREKFGESEIIPVAPSDVAFSAHAVLITVFTLGQIAIYDRGGQKASKPAIAVTTVAWAAAAVLLCVAWSSGDWLSLVYSFNVIQLVFTAIKYIPQVYFNYQRKSTIGWSIGNIILDVTGGLCNFTQMGVQSLDQYSVQNFTGNVGKVGLSLASIFFDVIFLVQHYVLYPKAERSTADEYEQLEDGDSETSSRKE